MSGAASSEQLSSGRERVLIREVGPREGFQHFHRVVPTEVKLRIIDALVTSGLKEIEVTSFVRPDRVPQLADAEEVVKGLREAPGVRYTALYLNPKGFERAEACAQLSNEGWLYTSPSESFLKSNANTTIEQAIGSVAQWCALFKAAGKRLQGLMVSNAFGCAYEGSISPEAVVALVDRYVAACAAHGEQIREVCLADTVGMAHPASVERCISAVRARGLPISLHLHDTRGLGIANAYAGLLMGVRTFESSVGGVGGCPFTPGASGNIATEDLVYLCESLNYDTGVNLAALAEAARCVESAMGEPLPGRVYKTFATPSSSPTKP